MVRIAFAAFMLLHGLMHLVGPTKAFGWAQVSQMRTPVSPAAGVCWLVSAVLLGVAAVGWAARAPWWWYLALPGVLLSQGLILTAWGDARLGTVANLIIAVPLLVTALDTRPSSFRSRFDRDHRALLAGETALAPLVTEADLAPLPPLMQEYLRRMGVVGRPHVRSLCVTFKAQMRSSATSPWMQATATEYAFFAHPARLFHMKAVRAGIPMDLFHRYVDGAATFQVRVAGLVPVVDKGGAEITNDETVTIMNDAGRHGAGGSPGSSVHLRANRHQNVARHVPQCRICGVRDPDVRRCR
ncbi:MAG: hypothetical protein IPK72_20220 [Candidatus Eisenbacteria bacterium]|nr:hypothetical protein [Candidatus Eisenbacteria bacterium]